MGQTFSDFFDNTDEIVKDKVDKWMVSGSSHLALRKCGLPAIPPRLLSLRDNISVRSLDLSGNEQLALPHSFSST